MLWRVEIGTTERWTHINSSLNLFFYLLQDLTRKCNNGRKCNNKSEFIVVRLCGQHQCMQTMIHCRRSRLLSVEQFYLLIYHVLNVKATAYWEWTDVCCDRSWWLQMLGCALLHNQSDLEIVHPRVHDCFCLIMSVLCLAPICLFKTSWRC